MIFIDELLKKKKSDTAIYLGCGPSINELNPTTVSSILNFDIWTVNNFIFHNFIVPDFYHPEIKEHRDGPIMRKMFKNKFKEYKNVNWVIDGTRQYLSDMLRSYNNVYKYNKDISNKLSQNGNYKPSGDRLQVRCYASLSLLLETLVRMEYKKIYFLGCDLYSSEYFWTNNNAYAHLNLNSEAPLMVTSKPDERSAESVHPTQERNIAKYIKEFTEYNNVEAINLSEKSLLKDFITTEKLW